MNKYPALLLVILLFVSGCTGKKEKKSIKEIRVAFINTKLSEKSNNFIIGVRDGTTDKQIALNQLKTLLKEVGTEFSSIDPRVQLSGQHVFPLKGYSPQISIGDATDEGYIPGRYDFFDVNNHKGHPALDIFISDTNQDCLDDITNSPIDILSLTSGVVLATEQNWDTASTLRGGKYIWIYDPSEKYLIYYAHNNSLYVLPGQIVQPGDKIATCGRTGLNAFKKRSPTHLHLMVINSCDVDPPFLHVDPPGKRAIIVRA